MAADQIDDDDNWIAGYYELALELGERDDARLEATLQLMRELAKIDGCWALTGLEPSRYEPVSPSLTSLLSFGQLRGSFALPTGERVVCSVVAVREEAEPPFYAPDWLALCIPLGALIKVEPRVGGYPFGSFEGSLQWRRPIDDWLANLGSKVFRATAFRLGLIGMEASGEAYSDRLPDGIPQERSIAYLWPERGEVRYFPATI